MEPKDITSLRLPHCPWKISLCSWYCKSMLRIPCFHHLLLHLCNWFWSWTQNASKSSN